jgi:hypothetical protein
LKALTLILFCGDLLTLKRKAKGQLFGMEAAGWRAWLIFIIALGAAA